MGNSFSATYINNLTLTRIMITETKKVLITSALPYVNNVPHLGNIVGCVLSADVFARFNRSIGNDTLFICGTDEHGTATENKAQEEGLTPLQICDKYHKIHKEIYDWFNISFDHFGRTSHKNHHKITQDIFLNLYKNGYVTSDIIEQLYCETCQKFLADRFVYGTCPYCSFDDARGDQCDKCGKLLNPQELKAPKCKTHKTTPVFKKTKHLFIDLEKLQPKLEEWVEAQSVKGFWPQNAVTTTESWLKVGLTRRAITRDLKWGIPVPLEEYKDKVFYVWFDAPIGYISITSEKFPNWKNWWKSPTDVNLYQFMAKDNIPFHTIVFPASLIGAGENNDEKYTLLHHISSTEYLNYEDGKFSKSRGTGVFGDNAKESGISADCYRYYLLINRPETSDATFSWQEFAIKINNELAANLGNFVNRTLSFIDRFQKREIKHHQLNEKELELWHKIKEEEKKVTQSLLKVEIKSALKLIMGISHIGNQFFQESKPWETIKNDPLTCERNLYLLTNIVKDLAILIQPFLPETSNKIFEQLNLEKKSWSDLGHLSIQNHQIGTPLVLFQKIEDKKVIELKQKFSGIQSNDNKNNESSDVQKSTIKPEDFSNLNLKVGKIVEIRRHPNAEKLYVEQIDFGTEKRQIVSGLVAWYKEEELLGKKVVVVTNLETAKLRGVESQGMLLAAENEKEGVGILFLENARIGDQVLIKDAFPTNRKIGFQDFVKVKMTVKNGVACFNDEILFAGVSKEIVKAEKISVGLIR